MMILECVLKCLELLTQDVPNSDGFADWSGSIRDELSNLVLGTVLLMCISRLRLFTFWFLKHNFYYYLVISISVLYFAVVNVLYVVELIISGPAFPEWADTIRSFFNIYVIFWDIFSFIGFYYTVDRALGDTAEDVLRMGVLSILVMVSDVIYVIFKFISFTSSFQSPVGQVFFRIGLTLPMIFVYVVYRLNVVLSENEQRKLQRRHKEESLVDQGTHPRMSSEIIGRSSVQNSSNWAEVAGPLQEE